MKDLNSPITNAVRMARINYVDTGNPLIAVRFSRIPIAGEDITTQRTRATWTVQPTSGGSSKLRILVKLYSVDENGDTDTTTTYTYDGVTGGSPTSVTATLGSLITALRTIPGITAYRCDAGGDYPLTTDDFIAVSETDISQIGFTKTLYRDVSEVYASSIRIGVPEFMDAGHIKLLGISGTVTGATSGTLRISRDWNDEDTDASDETLIQSFALVNTTETAYWNYNQLEAPTFQGPLLIEAASNDLSAANIVIRYINVEV